MDYTKLKKEGLKRGRPRLNDDERQARKALVMMNAEARRRAMLVICKIHENEFNDQVKTELRQLKKESAKQ